MSSSLDDGLFEWQRPEQMYARAEGLRLELGPMALRRSGKRFREAYAASRFARFRGADEIRLLAERGQEVTPDFEMRIGGVAHRFEITEADRPGRRRGAEDHSPITRLVPVQDDEWVEPDKYQTVVSCRAHAKAAKRYDSCQGLVIWSNAWPIADEEKLTLDWWRCACEPARGAFREVWVGMDVELQDVFQRIF